MQTDEIDLKKILILIFSQYKTIFIVTAFFFIISLIYNSTLTETYRTNSSFTFPSKQNIDLININFSNNNLLPEEITSQDIFVDFTTRISDISFKRKIFEDGGFVDGLILEPDFSEALIEPNINAFLNKIKISPPSFDNRQSVLESSYTISVVGDNKNLQEEFISALLLHGNIETVNSLEFVVLSALENKIAELELEYLSKKRAFDYDNREALLLLEEAAETAKALGIFENNLNLSISANGFTSPLPNSNFNLSDIPMWYLYGEKALNKEIELRSKREDEAIGLIYGRGQLPELADQINKLKRTKFNLNGVSSFTLTQVPDSSLVPNNKLFNLILSIVLGLVISIALILVRSYRYLHN